MDSNYTDNATTARRRRRISHAVREKTPDPNYRSHLCEIDNTLIDTADTNSEDIGTQVICMQIQPPRTMSAHESKILRRRDKTFASASSRSQSQPREAEKLSSTEATQIVRVVRRSLSTPRRADNEESSNGEMLIRGRTTSPEIKYPADESLSRLAQNMRKFEQERKRFEVEKRLFERERRDHILRHRQLYDSEERRRLLQNYRKLSDRFRLNSDSEEMEDLIINTKTKTQSPTRCNKKLDKNRQKTRLEESSTQFSSSEAENEEFRIQYNHSSKQLNQPQKTNSLMTSSSIRGPPPQPPIRRTTNRTTSRPTNRKNSPTSPIRPQGRSKTPDVTHEERWQINDLSSHRNINNLGKEKANNLRQRQRLNKNHSLASAKSEVIQSDRDRKYSIEKADQIDGASKSNADLPKTKIQIDKCDQEESAKPKESIFKKCITYPIKYKEANRTDSLEIESEKDTSNKKSSYFNKTTFKTAKIEWQNMKADYPNEMKELKRLQKKCTSHVILLILMIGFGGLMFRYTEGSAESIYKCEVRKVKRDFIDHLWTHSHNMREDDWKSLARQKLRKFEEELHNMGELGIRYFPGQKSWNFINCILYCWTVITTIGYGHITPKTTLGQALTIIYAIIGIPMFLILLADFGKLFTRAIKFVWGYVRRLYYRGTCRKIRKQQHVRDAMTGFTVVYDMAIRRPSHFLGMSTEKDVESQAGKSNVETPTSPYPDTIIVDDEFNLPISLASLLLVSYILIGAFVYTLWEDWTYFEAFYFVFISMSTIGFGDLVPNHPIFMMCSILYMILGLALTSMFINVVQIKLSDTFRQASAKIGATIGLGLASEKGNDELSQSKTPSDLASVHATRLNKIPEMENEYSIPTETLSQTLTSMVTTSATATPSRPTLESITQTMPRISNVNVSAEVEEILSDNENESRPPLLPKRQDANPTQSAPLTKKKKKHFF